MNLSCEQTRNVSAVFLRLGLGSLFLVSWQNKMAGNPAALYATVANSHLLSPPFDLWFATALPYWELAFGVLLLVGLGTRVTSLAAFLALTSYSIYIAQPASQARLAAVGLGPAMLSHDITFMLFTIALCVTGAGAYSVDALIRTRHGLARTWATLRGQPHVSAREATVRPIG
jgi:uncharacterized membrane protein YphA (DoxX/SURF4 family)